MELNLTNLLRPETLDKFIGQKHIIGKNKPLYKLILKKDIPHLFFYGKPGTGKTTLAKIIAKMISSDFYYFNATSLKIEDLRKIFTRYKDSFIKPLIFIDEVHRLSKNQQEVLLPVMEEYQAIIIGASTENPFFSLTEGIRSRGFIYQFLPHNIDDLTELFTFALEILGDIIVDDDAKEYIIYSSNGDGRAMLNLLDFAQKVNKHISLDIVKELRIDSIGDGVSSAQTHYDLASALIKSIRGSDIDASLYYLARLIEAGQSVEYISRRLVISASEDIGNANPHALNLAVSTQTATSKIGWPESKIILSQCVVYLASSPKSNSSYKAINQALQDIKDGVILDIPEHIKDKATGYKNPHNFTNYQQQNYLTKDLKYYNSKNIGFEQTLNQWNKKIKGL